MSHDKMMLLNRVDFELLKEEGYTPYVTPEQCVIVAHLHVLPSTVALFAQLKQLGFSMSSMVVVPKPYSTIAAAEDALKAMGVRILGSVLPEYRPRWYDGYMQTALREACAYTRDLARRRRAKRVVLVDDGGLLTDEWWRQNRRNEVDCISVQQTASGFFPHRMESKITKVDVARSTAKKVFESKVIIDGLAKRIATLQPVLSRRNIGVIGAGAIGSRLVQTLRKIGKTVWVYDSSPNAMKDAANRCRDWADCFQRAEVIFGCTGRDFSFPLDSLPQATSRTLISLSSRDVEFYSFLSSPRLRLGRRYADQRHFEDIVLQTGPAYSGWFRIMNGGFPINFDRRREWEAASEIVVTRALVLLGMLQALCVPPRVADGQVEALALAAQRKLVQSWLELENKTPEAFGVEPGDFDKVSWWWRPSHGQSRYRGNWKCKRLMSARHLGASAVRSMAI
jgi:hypothetical protein